MRSYLIWSALAIIALSSQSILLSDEVDLEARQPVVLIVFDDLFDIVDQKNLHGPILQTPNFDRLAILGTRFSNAFASIAVCNPSRTSFMTGQSPFRTTVHVPEPLQWNDVLSAESTIVELVGQAGYQTLSCGKVFHNQARASESEMFSELFDENFQFTERPELPAGEIAASSEEIQADDVHVNWAISNLNNYQPDAATNPFFLSVGILRPHRPFIAPQQYFDLYPSGEFNASTGFAESEIDLNDVSEFYHRFRLLTNYHNALVNQNLAVDFAQGYFASVSYADSLLGRLLDAIEANENLCNATIIVTSDNGYQLGEKLTWNKLTLWEECTKVPLYVVAPSLVPGTTCDVPVTLLDLAPTIAAVGNAGVLPLFDGDNLIDIATNPTDYDGRVAISSMVGSMAVRDTDHRLILYNDNSMELYDVVADPQQKTNLAQAGTHVEIIDELLVALSEVVLRQGGVALPDNSSIAGTAGDDTLFVIGAQAASGGTGDDLYFVSEHGSVVELPNEGYDMVVFADTEFQIPMGVESVRSSTYSNNLVYTVEGNEFDNRAMVTSSRADLRGHGGNDTLLTGNGRDVIHGGSGNDLIWTTGGLLNRLTGGEGTDVIIGGERTDIIRGGHSEDELIAGERVLEAGDFVITGDIYELSSVDSYLDNGDIRLANGTVVKFNTLALHRRGDTFFSYGAKISQGQGKIPAATDLELVNEILNRQIAGDFFLTTGTSESGDEVYGGSGGDAIFSQSGSDQIFAGDGNDLVVCGTGNNLVEAGSGNDYVRTLDGTDAVYGGPGNDVIDVGDGADFVDGGGGNNQIRGGDGVDTIVTLSGHDWIDCGTGNDSVVSGAGEDTVFGRDGDDEMLVGAGDDFCNAGPGNDTVFGGQGSDNLSGNSGNDSLYGQGGSDKLFGGFGDDRAEGGSDNDLLFGQSGVDQLIGGPGNDELNGGAGGDRFWFPAYSGVDRVLDFTPNQDFIVIPDSSELYSLSDDEILAGYVQFDGQDSTLAEGTKSLILLNTSPEQLVGRLINQLFE